MAEGNETPKGYLLFMMAAFYSVSVIDRSVLNIVAQEIKVDLGLTDLQLGILSGLAFGILYAGLGIPIARFAEKRTRITIISAALFLWSAATVACGLATNFLQLTVGRAGVGIGEAACTPCAHSMIADSFPPAKRAAAMSIYSAAIPVGNIVGMLAGAFIATHYSWRAAFYILGLPGIVLAVMAKITIKEPERGKFDARSSAPLPSYRQVLTHLLAKPTFIHMALGLLLTSVAAGGSAAFLPIFTMRASFGLDLQSVAFVGALGSVAMLIGILLGGFICDRLSARNSRMQMWVPTVSLIFTATFSIASLFQTDVSFFVAFQFLMFMGLLVYTGPTFGALHNMVEPRMRASAVATINLLTNLVGLGIGPLAVGWLSDLSAMLSYGAGGNFAADCQLSAAIGPACSNSSFLGLRNALIVIALLHIWGAVHYFLASKTIQRDLTQSDGERADPGDRTNCVAPI